MDRRQFLTLFAISGTTGCLRLTDGESAEGPSSPASTPERTPTPTATGTPTDTETPTETARSTVGQPDYPPGLSDEGVSVLLWDTHKQQLAQTRYHTEFRRVDVEKGGVKRSLQYDVKPGFALGSWVFDRGGSVEMYRTSDGSYWREDLGSKATYGEDSYDYSLDIVTWSK